MLHEHDILRFTKHDGLHNDYIPNILRTAKARCQRCAGSSFCPKWDTVFSMGFVERDLEVSIVMGVSQDEWFMMENPTKMDDVGVPYCRKPPFFEVPK